MNSQIRPPAVAGLFYPDNAEVLASQVNEFLGNADSTIDPPKALIGPHAGYPFSGAVAGRAYAPVRGNADRFSRVVLLGPSHRVPFRGMAASRADYFATPMGNVRVDQETLSRLASERDDVVYREDAHEREHGLEVHLPFLQALLGDFTVVPLVVGDASPEAVGSLLESVWGGPETLIVISSDLSHFMDYDSAVRRDRATSDAIETLRYEDVHEGDACGRHPVNGLLWLARRKGMQGRILDLRNSGDAGAPRDSVVGYGAYVFN
jgi:hypothetical protein